MKKSILLLCLSLFLYLQMQGQKPTNAWFAYFNWQQKGEKKPESITVGHYSGTVESKGMVTENPQTAKKLFGILQQLKSNGSEDVNKCFIPRHIVQVYSGDKLLYQALICFECDGIRFSNQPKTTPVKSVKKREQLMAELKTLFLQFHYLETGMPQPVRFE
jgi:hypothetical protein